MHPIPSISPGGEFSLDSGGSGWVGGAGFVADRFMRRTAFIHLPDRGDMVGRYCVP